MDDFWWPDDDIGPAQSGADYAGVWSERATPEQNMRKKLKGSGIASGLYYRSPVAPDAPSAAVPAAGLHERQHHGEGDHARDGGKQHGGDHE